MPGRRRLVALVVAGWIGAGIVAGCGPPSPGQPTAATAPTAPPPASPGKPGGTALLLLTTVDAVPALALVQSSVGSTALPLPDPSTMAVTAVDDGSLVALLADGRAFLAADGPAGLLAGARWRPIDLRWSGALPDDAIIFAATASPDGTRLAAIARPPFAESPSALVIVEPAAGSAEAVAQPTESLGAPPAWLDRDQVAILQRGRDARTLVAVVDLATGRMVDRIPFRALAFGTSGDGQTAVVLGDQGRLLVGPTTDVLEQRRAPEGGPDLAPGDVVRGGVALDRDGRRLAAVVEDAAGINRIATFVRAGDGWEPDVRLAAPPGSYGGRLAWLP